MFRAAEQHLVPETYAFVYAVVDIVAWQELPFVEPAPDTPALQCVVEPPCERFVFLAVADEA